MLEITDGRLVARANAEGERFSPRWTPPAPAERRRARRRHQRARELTGNILEDEKILGTVHVAFGASAGIGGTVSVPVHLDCLILDPTLEIGGTRVLERGNLTL